MIMEFTLKQASDWEFKKKVDIQHIEDLIPFTNVEGLGTCGFKAPYELIINLQEKTITIYDTYVE
jgi:hypothetical protein